MKNQIAIDINNNKVSIEDANKQTNYFCPTCGAPLIIRAEKSTCMRKHFAHKPGTHCTDDWDYEMSEWHLAWQEKFPVECREVVMEKDGEKHRADVFIYNTVIEFQHSPISYEDFTKRNNFYLKCGYPIVWIFDAEDRIKAPVEKIVESIFKKENLRNQDVFERAFEWKRCQNQFADFKSTYPSGARIAIYLETPLEGGSDNLLLCLKVVDPISPKAYHLEPCITTKNFLKEFGRLNDPTVLSMSDIFKATENLQKTLFPPQTPQLLFRPSYRPRPKKWL